MASHRRACLCRFESRRDRSRVLVATQPLQAGQIALEEAPLFLVRHGVGSQVAYQLSLFRAFQKQTEATRDKILDFYSPTDGLRAAALRAQLKRFLPVTCDSATAEGTHQDSTAQHEQPGNLLSEAELELCVKVTAYVAFASLLYFLPPPTEAMVEMKPFSPSSVLAV